MWGLSLILSMFETSQRSLSFITRLIADPHATKSYGISLKIRSSLGIHTQSICAIMTN